jgi:hypothetical protein
MAGLEGRCNLLIQLGSAIETRSDICASGRPGDILGKYTIASFPVLRLDFPPAGHFAPGLSTNPTLPLTLFWSTLFSVLLPIWPSRITLPSHPTFPLGDVWPCPSLSRALSKQGQEREEGDDLVPFHKLTQWLCYSLVEAIEGVAGWKVEKGRGQTGLPEVRPRLD